LIKCTILLATCKTGISAFTVNKQDIICRPVFLSAEQKVKLDNCDNLSQKQGNADCTLFSKWSPA